MKHTHRIREIEHASHERIHAISVPAHRGHVAGHIWSHWIVSGLIRNFQNRAIRFSVNRRVIGHGVFGRRLKGRVCALELISRGVVLCIGSTQSKLSVVRSKFSLPEPAGQPSLVRLPLGRFLQSFPEPVCLVPPLQGWAPQGQVLRSPDLTLLRPHSDRAWHPGQAHLYQRVWYRMAREALQVLRIGGPFPASSPQCAGRP
jgi:hypothetical protein